MKIRIRKMSSHISKMLLLIILSASFTLFSQDESSKSENSKVNEMTDKLNQKLLLSEEQKNEVEKILQEYFDGLQNESGNGEEAAKLQNTADEKIQSLFDKKQKMKFRIISNDWWALAKG